MSRAIKNDKKTQVGTAYYIKTSYKFLDLYSIVNK